MQSRFEQFSSVISGIHRFIQNIEREEMIKYGYKGSYAIYLVTVQNSPDGITASQLCEQCDKDKAAVSRTLSQMEADGLIERIGCGGNLYRAKVMLTPKGKDVAEFVRERAHQAVKAVSGEFSEEKRQIMYEYLDEIYTRLQAISESGLPD